MEAECLGGLEVDSQFELRWLLNGKIRERPRDRADEVIE